MVLPIMIAQLLWFNLLFVFSVMSDHRLHRSGFFLDIEAAKSCRNARRKQGTWIGTSLPILGLTLSRLSTRLRKRPKLLSVCLMSHPKLPRAHANGRPPRKGGTTRLSYGWRRRESASGSRLRNGDGELQRLLLQAQAIIASTRKRSELL